ncbi:MULTISPECIES: DUF5677 domain-containing protein [Lysinibacillus]|uniref:DUF5677 domain-containing protein n=1 Tax=Lysinibacillus TaxID=400634 RepID=UPI0025913631|nr:MULTISPECIES: DUF5677 domain-containing protein [Lysinibacillus]
MSRIDTYNLLDKLNVYSDDLFEVFYYLENLREYQENVEESFRQYFYHIYLKCKRNYKAIKTLINLDDEDLRNGYVEATPLLRTLIESYFHLCYVTKSLNKEEVIRSYDLLNKYQLKQMLNNKTGYKIVFQGDADKQMLNGIKQSVNKVKEEDIRLFKSAYQLAKKTNNLDIYNGIYQKFNSYVHYNPTTFISYGTMEGQDSFTFGAMQHQPERECEILYYMIEVALKILITTMDFLRIDSVDNWVFEVFMEWENLLKEYDSVDLVNYL